MLPAKSERIVLVVISTAGTGTPIDSVWGDLSCPATVQATNPVLPPDMQFEDIQQFRAAERPKEYWKPKFQRKRR